MPNVWYEKILKTEGEDEWARNIQVTCWIFLWIAASQLGAAASAFRAGVPGAVAPWASPYAFGSSMIGSMEGITPAVWAVVALKSLNGILIPATLKYAGNLVYLYAKPTSIVATALAAAAWSGAPPPLAFSAGAVASATPRRLSQDEFSHDAQRVGAAVGSRANMSAQMCSVQIEVIVAEPLRLRGCDSASTAAQKL